MRDFAERDGINVENFMSFVRLFLSLRRFTETRTRSVRIRSRVCARATSRPT